MVMRLISFLFILNLAVCAFAQELVAEHYPSGTELWLLLPYETFIFGKEDPDIPYQLSLEVKNEKGRQIYRKEQELIVPKRDFLSETALPFRYSFQPEPGRYTVNLVLLNKKLGDKRSFQRIFSFNGNYTELGQVYLIAERDGFEYIPHKIELANNEKMRLLHSFSIPAAKIELWADSLRVFYTEPESPWEIELSELFEQDEIIDLRLSIWENNIRYDLEPLLYKAWLSFSQRYSWQDQLAQIRYIATQNEFKTLRKVPDARLADTIELFWLDKDPSPGTIKNEYREKFYARVLKADEMFSIHKRLKGWKSDRGRIYIKFGEPDEIVNDYFPIGRPPNIRWYYYRLNKIFLFTDEKGYGQYNLKNKDEEYYEN